MSLMGIDVGTTGCKAVIFDADGRELSKAYREYPLISIRTGWFELDPRVVLDRTREAVREACSKCTDPVTALAVSSQGEAVTPISKSGEILANSITSSCPRTADLIPEWDRRFGKKYLYEMTGAPLAPCFTPLRLEWIKQNDPDTYARAERFLFFEDLVFWALGVEPVTDLSEASRSMCLDLATGEYAKEIFDAIGFDTAKLPPVKPSGTLIGEVPDSVAAEWGLPKGVKVVTGGHDQPAAALGCGVIETGQACYGIGTVECVTCSLSEPLINDLMLEYNICCYHHTFPNRYVFLLYNWTGGTLFRWYRDTFGAAAVEEARRRGVDVYDVLTERMPADPTRLFVLPHFTTTGTPHFDARSAGAILGLSLSTSEGEIIRAILEGITYEIAMCVEVFSTLGHPLHEFRCSGGGAKSAAWMQIKADILNAEIAVPEVNEAGCLGMALLAGTATGVYPSLAEAVARTVKVGRRYQPNPKHAAIYRENMALYRDIYPTIRDLNHRITTLQGR